MSDDKDTFGCESAYFTPHKLTTVKAERLHAVTCAVPAAYFADDKDCTCGLADQVNAACDPKPVPAPAEAVVEDALVFPPLATTPVDLHPECRQRITDLEATLDHKNEELAQAIAYLEKEQESHRKAMRGVLDRVHEREVTLHQTQANIKACQGALQQVTEENERLKLVEAAAKSDDGAMGFEQARQGFARDRLRQAVQQQRGLAWGWKVRAEAAEKALADLERMRCVRCTALAPEDWPNLQARVDEACGFE